MVIIIFLLIINFIIAIILNKLIVQLSILYVENSQLLITDIRKDIYDLCLKIYKNPKCLDKLWVQHIPFYNLI